MKTLKSWKLALPILVLSLLSPLLASQPKRKTNTDKLNLETDKFFKSDFQTPTPKQLIQIDSPPKPTKQTNKKNTEQKLLKKYQPMYDYQNLSRKLMGDPSAEEGNEIGILLGQTMGGVMSLSLADTPKVVMVDQAPFYSYI